jgi:hypothetical protein
MRWAIRSETRLYFLLLVHGHAHILYMHRIGCEGGVVSRRVNESLERHVVKDVYWPLCTFPQIDAAIVSSVVYLFHDLFASFFFVSSLSRLCRGRRAPRCVNLNSL